MKDPALISLYAIFIFGLFIWCIGIIIDKFKGSAWSDAPLVIGPVMTIIAGSILIILSIVYFMFCII